MEGTGYEESWVLLWCRDKLSKPLLQLSADGWHPALSLLVVCPEGPVLESTGSKAGLRVTARGTNAKVCLSGQMLPVPLSLWQATPNSCLCRRPSKYSQTDLA